MAQNDESPEAVAEDSDEERPPSAPPASDNGSDGQPTPSEAVAAVLSSGLADDAGTKPAEPSATQVAQAVRALEEAAQVEAEMAKAPDTANGVDLVTLTETLNGIHSEIAAVRELVEAFEIGMRRQLDEIQAQMSALRANGQSGIATAPAADGSGTPGPAFVSPSGSSDPTGPLPTMPGDSLTSGEEVEPVKEHRTIRRVLLVFLLLVLGVLLAGGIALVAAVGWDSLRDAGLIL